MLLSALLVLLASVSQYGDYFNDDGVYLGDTHYYHGDYGLVVIWMYMPGLSSIEICKDYFAIAVIADYVSSDDGVGTWVYPAPIPVSWGSGTNYRLRIYDVYGNERWSEEFTIRSNGSVSRTSNRWAQGMSDLGVQWSGFGESIYLWLESRDGGSTFLGSYSGGSGSASVEIQEWIEAGSGYSLTATDAYGNTASSSSFSILPVNVSSPSAAETWRRGECHPTIRWTGMGNEARVQLMRGAQVVAELTDDWIANTGEYRASVTIPETWLGGDGYYVRVSVRTDSGEVLEGDSDQFSIAYSDNEVLGGLNLSIEDANTGMIDYPDDIDYWIIRCLPMHTYEITMESNASAVMEVYQNANIIATSIDNRVCWDSDMGGTYFLKITGLPGQEGSYAITPNEKQYPEAHRTVSISIAGTTLLSNGFNYGGIGFEAGVSFSPVRYIDVGVSYSMMQANEAIQAIVDPSNRDLFSVMELSAGLQSPELTGLSARAGASYNIILSEPQYYWISPEYNDLSDAFVSGIRPYFGLDWKVFSERYGSAIFVRLQRSFISFKAGRMSIGMVISF